VTSVFGTDMDGWIRVVPPTAANGRLSLWRSSGSGWPVLAVHGMEDSWRSWDPLVRGLAGRYRFYALDMPWRTGNSYAWREHGTAGEWLRRGIALLPEPVRAVLGHSFGANAVLDRLAVAASGDPDQLDGIEAAVLVAPFYSPASVEVTPALRDRSLRSFRTVISDGMLSKLGDRVGELEPEIMTGMRKKLLERVVPIGFPVFFDAFIASGQADLTGVTVPTLVLGGVDDDSLTARRAASLATDMPAVSVRQRTRYSHFCHFEQADEVSAEVGTFLDRHLSPKEETTVTVLLDGQPTTYVGAPRYEGANIRTWIGFKHFMYLTEEAILAYFRDRGVGARQLYHDHHLGLEIVDNSIQLPAPLEVDDEVTATVVSGSAKPGQGAPFVVQLAVTRDGKPVTVGKAKVRVALIELKEDAPAEPAPALVQPFVVPEVAALANRSGSAPVPIAAEQDVLAALGLTGSNAFLWSWRAPYFYCHFSDRLQHSAYVRAMEEVVDRFLVERGLAIGKLLTERSWIPVVSRARVQMLDDVWMEEIVHTVFTVEDVLKDMSYTARMDCYVRRGGELVRSATGTIMHGYAISRGPDAGTVAVLDPATQAALLGGRA